MVVIRLSRCGKKHEPKFRVAVADSRRFVKKKYLEILGFYNPLPKGKETKLTLDLPKVDEWIKKGAKPTERVKHLIKLAQKQNSEKAEQKVEKNG